jgi:hypothetical protein
MEARRFVDEYSGFFSGGSVGHDDVDDYFTRGNFAEMFGEDDADLPNGLDWDEVCAAAHDLIDERDEEAEGGAS